MEPKPKAEVQKPKSTSDVLTGILAPNSSQRKREIKNHVKREQKTNALASLIGTKEI